MTRAASLVGFADLARQLGLDPDRLVESVGVPREVLYDPNLTMPSAKVTEVLEEAAALAGAPDFGLRLGAARRLSNWSAVAILAREQPSLAAALDVMARYSRLQNDVLKISVTIEGDRADLRLDLKRPGPPPGRQGIEMTVAMMFRNLQDLMGPTWRPRHATFRHAAPRASTGHRKVFGTEVLFGHGFDGMVLNIDDLALPVPGADREMARRAERVADELLGRVPQSLSDHVIQLATELLPADACSRERVASQLGLGVKTLQRRLTDEGVTFAGLIDETRRQMARRYVEGSDRPLQQVAELLGFATQSAFTHWHRGQFGESPSDRRRAGRHNRANSED